jgi:hypothetical protein
VPRLRSCKMKSTFTPPGGASLSTMPTSTIRPMRDMRLMAAPAGFDA